MLDKSKYVVVNLGKGGRTMLKSGDDPYWKHLGYLEALALKPDIVIIGLGTNDSKDYQWNESEYISNYKDMASTFMSLQSKPRLYFMIPPPIYEDLKFRIQASVVNHKLPFLIPQIAKDISLPADRIINLFKAFGGVELSRPELLKDNVHPNDRGYLV